MAGNVIETLSEDFLQCTICTEPYNEPKMLPCLHSFCLQCLERWATNRHDQPLSCPTCRCTVDLPSNGISGLPHNFFLVSLMERLEEVNKLSSENQDYTCNICKNKKDIMFCLDCKMHVCDSCKETHDRFTRSSDHPLIPSDKLSDENYLQRVLSTQAPYCVSHKQEKVRYYCTQCNQLACQVCAIVSHQGHQSLQEVENKVNSVKSKLEILLANSKSQKEFELQQLQRTERQTEDIKKEISELCSKIDARYEQVVAKLQSDKEDLREKLREIENTKCSNLKDIEETISNWLKAMENTQEMTRRILDQNNMWEILEMENDIAGSMERLKKDRKKMHIGSIPGEVNLTFNPAELAVLDADKDEFPRRTGRSNRSSENTLRKNFLGEFEEKVVISVGKWLKTWSSMY